MARQPSQLSKDDLVLAIHLKRESVQDWPTLPDAEFG